MIKQKLKLYYKFLVQKLFQCVYGKILITNKSKKLIKKIKVNNSIFKTFNNKRYYLYNIKKARHKLFHARQTQTIVKSLILIATRTLYCSF